MRRPPASTPSPHGSRLDREQCANGILEISAWNQANALRQVTVKRGLDVREFPMVTFGGSGSLLACRLMDILGLPAVLVPPSPGTVSAYGLLTVDVRNDYVQTSVARHTALDLDSVGAIYDDLAATARNALSREGFATDRQVLERTADLRYFGQAFEVRVDCPDGDIDRRWADLVADAFHDAHRALYGYDFRGQRRPTGRVGEPTGDRGRADPAAEDPRDRGRNGSSRRCGHRQPSGPLRRGLDGCDPLRPGGSGRRATGSTGPAVVQEFGSTVPIHPGYLAAVDRFGNLVITAAGRVGP